MSYLEPKPKPEEDIHALLARRLFPRRFWRDVGLVLLGIYIGGMGTAVAAWLYERFL